MEFFGALRQKSVQPTMKNIKQLLEASRKKYQDQKATLQQLMNRDVHTNALLHSQAVQAQLLCSEIQNIKSGNMGPELQTLKNQFTRILEEGVRSEAITNVYSLSRLESAELGRFMEIMTNNRNGLTFSFIEEIPTIKYKKDQRPEEEICAVCHEEFEEAVQCIGLDCKHIFHRKCISQWLKVKRNCPMCKKEVRVDKNTVWGKDENISMDNGRAQRLPFGARQ